MAKIQLSQIRALDDTLTGEAFELQFGDIPGVGENRELTLRCLNCVIPGFSNEAFDIAIQGHVVRQRGRKMYPRTLTATFYENAKSLTILNSLRKWHEYVVGTNSGSGLDKAGYSVTARLTVYNQMDEAVSKMDIFGVFPQDVQDVSMSGDSSTPLQISASFSYDYYKELDIDEL